MSDRCFYRGTRPDAGNNSEATFDNVKFECFNKAEVVDFSELCSKLPAISHEIVRPVDVDLSGHDPVKRASPRRAIGI